MSRIGRAPISIPKGVELNLTDRHLVVKGPKGQLERDLHPEMDVKIENGILSVYRPSDQKRHRALHGLTRALINNMVVGVTAGFKKQLEIIGVGYRAELKKAGVLLNVGYSHAVMIYVPEGVKAEVPTPTSIIISGADAEMVGQIAAEIRAVRKPEPYKGKGIRYVGEYVARKAGKTAK
ncbi:50S ribosomal protein L6 [bacterium]|nr:50S ribosomal protein L6 [bacterium]MBU1637882.1 50S ribosomal protein L6 [bacterium]MBU1920822.1 50S ribosomal protein L6 [bacterium]RQV94211.1 MAG: 50S ribosomal protein L6 [bacterium]